MSEMMLSMCTLRISYFESGAEISRVSHREEITWCEKRLALRNKPTEQHL